MTRVSAVLVAFSLTLFSNWASVSAEQVVESKPFQEAYLDAIKAEHQLLLAQLTKEKSRLATLQELRNEGHASWLEMRHQQLNFDQQKTAVEMYGRFGRYVEQQENLAAPSQWKRLTIGQLPFTDLMLSSKQHDDQPLDLAQLATDYRSLIAEQQAARDKLEFELNSLTATDPWRKGYNLRLQVANSELKASQAQARLLDTFRQQHLNDGLQDDMNFASKLTDSKLAKSICDQCEVHIKLIDHSLQSESLRLGKLVELQKLGGGSQRDIDAATEHRNELSSMKQMHTSVMNYLHEIAEEPAVDENANDNFVAEVGSRNTWEEIRNQFFQLEAQAQYKVAKLEKEMQVEILQRLQTAAASNAATSHGGQLSASLAAGQQAELQNHQRKIEFADLQMQLAITRQHSLQQHRLSNTYVVAINDNNLIDKGPSLSLSAAKLTTGPSALLSGFVTSPVKANLSSTSKGRSAFLSHAGFGSFSSIPTRFGSLHSGFRSARFFNSPLHLNSSIPLSLRTSRSPLSTTSLGSRSSNSALFPKRNFGSTFLYKRSLPTFHRPYQNGNLKLEYRRFLTPGQTPFLFPGSPSNFRKSPFRKW